MKIFTSRFIVLFTLLLLTALGNSLNAQISPSKEKKFYSKYENNVPLENLSQQNQKLILNGKKCCDCIDDIIQNGSFSEGPPTSGNIGFPAKVPGWNRGSNTPKYYPNNGCSSPGFMYLWGNKVVSESIWQEVNFKKGQKYKGCFAFKYVFSQKENPSKHIRFKLLASKINNLNTPICSAPSCALITISQTITKEDGWQVHYFDNWIADDDYDYIYVVPENDQSINGPNHISHGFFDELCIEEDEYHSCEELSKIATFDLTSSTSQGNILTELVFTPASPTPIGVVDWWGIYEAANCKNDDFTILNEHSPNGAVALRNISYEHIFTVVSPDAEFPDFDLLRNKCYIIKHGLYYCDGKGCEWTEKRGKIKPLFNGKHKNTEIKYLSE